MSLSLAAPAGSLERIALLESFDGMAGLRHALAQIAKREDTWAGCPMPLDDLPLVIEPSYPRAASIMEATRERTEESEEVPTDVRIRNTFWSWRFRQNVTVYERNGKIRWTVAGVTNRMDLELATLGASDAWGIEQEHNALNLLASLLKHRQFKQYLLTGMFAERSARSGLHYLFRKLRPTLAFTTQGERLRIMCALCLHPIGYYAGSWAGAMAPTDDVVAHLSLMRGDEAMFWRRANQHPAFVREAGI